VIVRIITYDRLKVYMKCPRLLYHSHLQIPDYKGAKMAYCQLTASLGARYLSIERCGEGPKARPATRVFFRRSLL
jgi:hypothetical protein